MKRLLGISSVLGMCLLQLFGAQSESSKNNTQHFLDAVIKGDLSHSKDLEDEFKKSADKQEKQMIASVLLSAGVKNQDMVAYLLHYAKQVIDRPVPYPLKYDSSGNVIKGEYSRSFLSWAKKNKVDAFPAAEHEIYEAPGEVLFIAAAGISEDSDLLMKGLRSSNPLVRVYSAKGLAKNKEYKAVTSIINACRLERNRSTARKIAYALVFFDSPTAINGAQECLRDESTLHEFQKERDEKGTKSLFGY